MDKLLHYFISMCIVLICWTLLPGGAWSIVLASVTALGAGLGKEIFDYTRDGSLSSVDIKDILADLAGIITGVLVILINLIIY